MPKVKVAAAELGPGQRTKVDWSYLLFFIFFFVCLMLVALFGVIAET